MKVRGWDRLIEREVAGIVVVVLSGVFFGLIEGLF